MNKRKNNTSPLKIAVLGHKTIPSRQGGIEIVVEELTVRMAKLGHKITVFYVKPNLMQMGKYISYVVTDPKGTIIIECGMMLVRNGYKIKVLNTINFSKSMHYNPFHYIRSEKDILKLVNTIMVNTKGEGEKSSEDFWSSATRSQTVKSLRTSNGFPLFGELVV